MKKVWDCKWEIVPGDGEHTDVFKSFEEAKKAMRQVISENIDLKKYLSWICQDEEADCKDAVKFLHKYFTEPGFPESKEDVPCIDLDFKDLTLELDASRLRWDYGYDGVPRLFTNFVLADDPEDDYDFHFWFEDPDDEPEVCVKAISISIKPRTDWGTSAYPLMVLKVLSVTPMSQDTIASKVRDFYNVKMERKAVGRHIKLLQELGFDVRHNRNGYYIPAAEAPDAYPETE